MAIPTRTQLYRKNRVKNGTKPKVQLLKKKLDDGSGDGTHTQSMSL